jgi:hypothetical protein
MNFACSRCAHRQAEDASCAGCGNEVVQDLRDPRARGFLFEEESRYQRKRNGRMLSGGAVVGLLAFFPSMVFVGGGMIVAFATAFVVSAGAVVAIDRLFGGRRKFPYLEEFEKR